MTPAIKVIIVNFNAGEALLNCINSVLASTEHAGIVIVDNHSSDGSEQLARARYGHLDNLEVLNNARNLGFAPAVNSAARSGSEPFLLILNPDCELAPDAMKLMKAALLDDSNAALAGPAVFSASGKMQKSALRRFPRPWQSLMSLTGLARWSGDGGLLQGIELPTSTQTIRAEAVSGACMLVRKAHFAAAGGMDEAYAMHCEDLDLMYRLHQLGHHCLFVPEARAVHIKGLSSRSRRWWVHRHKHVGMQRFYGKYQAASHVFPLRWMVYGGIWLHFLLTLPLVPVRS